jgi:tetratricopeptide (TPR) repeat protein
MRKPRPDSKLKNLPAKQQDELRVFLQTHTLEDTVPFVKSELDISTSEAALSKFRDWYDLTHELSDSAELADAVKELLSNKALKLDPETVSQAAQICFENRALKRDDGKLFVALRQSRQYDQRLRQFNEALKLDREKFEEQKSKNARAADSLKAVVAKGGIAPETLERIEEALKLL